MVFVPAENAAKTTSQSETQNATEQLQFARSVHQRACEELFLLCYEIQVSGEFPDPAVLAQMILHYRETRALLEERPAEPRAEASTKTRTLNTLLERFRIP